MKSMGEQDNAKRGNGDKKKPSKMHASERCTQACGTHAKQAGMQEGREKRGGKREREEEEERRLSALGSQDVKARQVGPGIDASAILFKHQREA